MSDKHKYPDGFDSSCGFSAEAMCLANRIGFDRTGNRNFDVPMIASVLEGFADRQAAEACEAIALAIRAFADALEESSKPANQKQKPNIL